MRSRHIVAAACAVLLCASQSPAQDESLPPEQIHIRLERTPGLGKSPTYTVDIDGDGQVTYDGTKWVSTIGRHTWRVPQDDVVQLVNRFLDAHFLEAATEYRTGEHLSAAADGTMHLSGTTCADLPGARLTLNLGEKSHTVFLYHNYPEELALLPMDVDDTAQVAGRARARDSKGSAVESISTQ